MRRRSGPRSASVRGARRSTARAHAANPTQASQTTAASPIRLSSRKPHIYAVLGRYLRSAVRPIRDSNPCRRRERAVS
jgi:hypothetical protein